MAFDINAARISGVADGAPPRPTPTASAGPRAPGRAKARAELAAAYAGLLGAELPAADILEQMLLAVGEATAALTGAAGGEIAPEHIAAVLRVAGMTAAVEELDRLTPGQWPALAQMTSGQMVLVIAQEGGTLFVYDKTCPDQRAEVQIADFAPISRARSSARAARSNSSRNATRSPPIARIGSGAPSAPSAAPLPRWRSARFSPISSRSRWRCSRCRSTTG